MTAIHVVWCEARGRYLMWTPGWPFWVMALGDPRTGKGERWDAGRRWKQHERQADLTQMVVDAWPRLINPTSTTDRKLAPLPRRWRLVVEASQDEASAFKLPEVA